MIISIVLLMSESESADKKVHNKHDNCENCVRQRKENQSFIQIYERLQEVEKKTFKVRQAVQNHRISSDTNRSFYNSLQSKMVSLPKVKKEANTQFMEGAGFQVAIVVLEKDSKAKLMQENERLRKLLRQMRYQKWQRQSNAESLMSSSCFTERRQPIQSNPQLQRTFNSCQTSVPRNYLATTQDLQKFLMSSQGRENSKENTTQSSSFSGTHQSKNVDLNKYNDMNLWLYQNEKNSRLQQQLYLPSQRKKPTVSRSLARGLPSIRPKK